MRAAATTACAALLALAIPASAHAAPADPEPAGAFEPVVNATWRGAAGEHDGGLDGRVPCIGNGTAGKRVEVIYLHPNDVDDRITTFREPIRKLVAWNEACMPADRPIDFAGGTGTIPPGATAWTELDLPPGDYIALCVVQGPAHVAHVDMGMVAPFTIT